MPAVVIHRLDQRPDLIDRIYEVDSAWPEFMGKPEDAFGRSHQHRW